MTSRVLMLTLISILVTCAIMAVLYLGTIFFRDAVFGSSKKSPQDAITDGTLVTLDPSDESSILNLPRVSNDPSIACRHFVIPPYAWRRKQTITQPLKHPACLEEPWVTMNGDTAYVNNKVTTCAVLTGDDGSKNCIASGPATNVSCEFIEIIRVDDYTNILLKPVVSARPYKLRYSDVLAVNCTNGFTHQQWKSVLQGTSPSIFPAARAQSGWEFLPKTAAKLNVLIWVLDSVSRNAFIRNLPLAWEYMENHMKGILFRGYNIQGLNTAPNMMPLYFGLPFDEWHSDAKWKYLDDAPNGHDHLMRHFQRNGYLTAYFEDFNTPPETGTFQYWYKLHGWRNPIATHYSRNFMISYSRTMGISWNECYDNVTANTVNQDYMKALWTAYHDKPKMFVSHTALYSHHGEHLLQKIADELLSLLQWMNEPSIRNNTLIIIMSDHGNARVNPLWPSLKGLLEFQMPFMYMMVPDWMEVEYPQEMKNLRLNARERLVTTLDLHYTLKHLLHMNERSISRDESFKPSSKAGQSLFEEVPKRRTCQDAGIPEYWCACLDGPRPVWKNETAIVRKCVERAFEEVNQHLAKTLRDVSFTFDEDTKCANWSLLEIKNAWLVKGPGFTGGNSKWQHGPRWGNDSHYSISVLANPGNVPFQLGARYREWTDDCQVGLDHTTRRDQYDLHSGCIEKQLPNLKKWCYCI